MESSDRHLVILGCSSTKFDTTGHLPAIERYDGPMYRVLRSFLRETVWPSPLSVGVLSAQYGLIGGLAPIEYYDRRMDPYRAAELAHVSTHTLIKWGQSHRRVSLLLGKDYLPALDFESLDQHGVQSIVVDGPIGIKLNRLRDMLHGMQKLSRVDTALPALNRSVYFLPDWDDMLDAHYDFREDHFSSDLKSARGERHCIQVMQPERMCDGVLVSLAQHLGSKGVLKKFGPTDVESLAPQSFREKFGLGADQWVFGDCGAFTYVNEPQPTITTDQALSLYQIYGFDFGASVDHIPVPDIITEAGKRTLTEAEREQRVKLTQDNAVRFLALHRQHRCTFTPVGIIQGLSPESFATQLPQYAEMGYRHIAIGGMVPRSDGEILETMDAIHKAKALLRRDMWIHLFGVFRPKIHAQLRALGVTSFDSATYFRKAWLRSDQNYLATDGNWYAAIRVPMTSDPRTRLRLQASGIPLEDLEALERTALRALHEYGDHRLSLDAALKAIASYDFTLSRSLDHGTNLLPAYARTLAARPWESCTCPVCLQVGIDVLIFRGANRNKRRGAHNTLMLYDVVGNVGGPVSC